MQINVKKLQREMARTGLKKCALAKSIGLHYQGLDYILKTKQTRLTTIQKIADYFDMDAKDLLVNK
jgi:DNA-binding Xre family transcriptional regulator